MTPTISKTDARFFIAVPRDRESNGAIFGIGTSEQAAIKEANSYGDSPSDEVEVHFSSEHGMKMFYVGEHAFYTPDTAEAYVATLGFKAIDCTQALYNECLNSGGAPSSWGRNADNLADLPEA